MNEKHLNIIKVQKTSMETHSRSDWRQEARAQFERMWLMDPGQFDPMRNCRERERLERTWHLMQEFLSPQGKLVADLACGCGALTKRLKDNGAKVHALDIAANALKILRVNVPNVDQTYQECLPHTTLEDDVYDLVFADEVIAYLPSQQLRLFMAELCRLVKPNGYVVCSTPLDFKTQDPLLRFASLAETEFKIHKWVCSYHRLHIHIQHFFSAPGHFAKAASDSAYRQQELQKRRGFSQKWFKWNSQGILAFFWKGIRYATNPIALFLKQNRPLLLFLEKICRALQGDSGISHAIFLASRRPLQSLDLPKDEIPIERKGKHQVWE